VRRKANAFAGDFSPEFLKRTLNWHSKIPKGFLRSPLARTDRTMPGKNARICEACLPARIFARLFEKTGRYHGERSL
jgi:hypothetical protein